MSVPSTERLIRATGPIPARLAFIGEAGGETEARKGRAFCGKAGELFDELLWAEGIARSECYVDNVFPFWPGPGNPDPPADGVLEYGGRLLYRLDEEVKPDIIVPLGRVATRFFLGDVDMEAVHGLRIEYAGRHFVPCYHPAAGLHNADLLQYTAYDLKQVASALKTGGFKKIGDQYPLPVYRKWEGQAIGPGNLYVDTEGVPGRPWCLTFTAEPGQAWIVLASDAVGLAKFQKLTRRRRVCFHNAMWDLQMLREMGIEVDPNLIDDTIVKSYNLRVEPQGLKALAYRHAGMVMQSYDDLTLPYDNEMMEDFLLEVMADPRSKVKPDPILEEAAGKQKVRQPQDLNRRVWSILTKIEPESRLRKRWETIEPEIRAGFEAPIFTLDRVPFEKAKYYACRDADATCRVDKPLTQMVEDLEVGDAYRLDMDAIPMFERMQSNGMPYSMERSETLREFLTDDMARIRRVIEKKYNDGKFLNPDSGDQVSELLFNKLGLLSTRRTKSRTRLSTDDKALEALRGQHPAVADIGDYRERSKARQFVRTIPKFLGEDGRVRGNIRVTRVVTGRPSMSEPNLLAIPVRSDVGRLIRDVFVARQGRMLGTCDLDQVEMRVMADYCKDEKLVGLFNSGRDVHAQTASDMFGVPLAQVDPMKHRYPAKRVGFGIITGIQGPGLLDQMHLAGIYNYDLQDCDRMIESFKHRIYPGVGRFMKECRLEAKQNGYVRDRIGRIRFLPGVRAPWEWAAEEALRASHSHKIQATAAWLIKRAMKRLWDLYTRYSSVVWEPLLQIYDEVIVEFGEVHEKEVHKMLLGAMTADTDLFCVPIKAKFASGPDWGSLEK